MDMMDSLDIGTNNDSGELPFDKWQNIEVPFSDNIACLAITKRGNVLIKTSGGETWLANKIKLDRWHKIATNILYSSGGKPKVWQ